MDNWRCGSELAVGGEWGVPIFYPFDYFDRLSTNPLRIASNYKARAGNCAGFSFCYRGFQLDLVYSANFARKASFVTNFCLRSQDIRNVLFGNLTEMGEGLIPFQT